MRYQTQRVAYAYWVVALLLYGLQMVFGLLAAAKYLGPDPLRDLLPFDRVKEIHTNVLLVWVLTGFMGGAYWVVPEESRTELYSPRLAYWSLALWTLAGVTAVVGYLFGWTEAQFLQRMEGSAIRRIGYARWSRNIAVALGNAPASPDIIAALERRADDPSPLVREHVAWALAQQRARRAA